MPSPTPRRLGGAPAMVMSFALALGALGAVGAYRAVAQAGASSISEVPVASVPSAPVAKPVHRRTVVRWAPCKAPAVLRHGVCVTEQVREVVLPAPAPVVRASYTAPAASGTRHSGSGSSHASGSGTSHTSGSSAGHEDAHHSDDGPEHESPEVETGD